MIPGSANALLLGSAGGYTISRSLRFNAADSAYLSRTPASAGNRKTWTWAGWVKRGSISVRQFIFGNINAAGSLGFVAEFASNDTLYVYDFNTSFEARRQTSQQFRDPSAWYHFVIVYDSTNATASDRLRLYVNGTRITAFSTSTDPTLNNDGRFNTAVPTAIGGPGELVSMTLSAYLADIHFIDGQALTPTSFGEFSATTGVWMPKRYAGTYGTNGFKVDFSDNSAATATTLGKDSSGNGNNWTPNNLSVTAGVGNDSLVDVPVNGTQPDTGAGGEVRGNYCNWNGIDKSSNVTLSNGNLNTLHGGAAHTKAVGNVYVSSGKWYAEFTLATKGGDVPVVGINSLALSNRDTYVGSESGSFGYSTAGLKYSISTPAGTAYGTTFAAGDVIGVALDLDAGTLVFYKNGSSQGTAFTGISGTYTFAASGIGSSASWVANWGQRPFAYTAPSGFKALCTANLPAPTIVKPSTVMDVGLYTGNGTTQNVGNFGFAPDLVWIKGRSGATDHALYDTVRGTQTRLESNTTDAEVTSDGGLTAFVTGGFSLAGLAQVNTNAATYVSWAWDAGSSTVTNTSGTISSQVRANASAGFSVVTYTGTGANATVGHGLGVAPGMVIVKRRDATANWQVRHTSIAAASSIQLNLTNAAASAATVWNSTAPSSTVFSIGTDATVNSSAATYVAYCFAPVAGYSAFGSYTGNGSVDGPFVYTGFRTRWLLYKNTAAGNNWILIDTSRDPINVCAQYLFANAAGAEATFGIFDFLSNGFKARTNDSQTNLASNTYVYAAFAESPFSLARAR